MENGTECTGNKISPAPNRPKHYRDAPGYAIIGVAPRRQDAGNIR